MAGRSGQAGGEGTSSVGAFALSGSSAGSANTTRTANRKGITTAPSPRLKYSQTPRVSPALQKARRQDSPSLRRHRSGASRQCSSQRAQLADEPLHDLEMSNDGGGSRKGRQSITHLLNYSVSSNVDPSLAYRCGHPNHRGPYGPQRRPNGNPRWGLGSGYHAADKARYIHANFRFVVDPQGDYDAQVTNADVHLDWKDVWQILFSTHWEGTSCPICLSTPVGPRMAKCGHIFCLPCLIRYMHSDDDSATAVLPDKRPRWKKCPICFDSLYVSETRPLRWHSGQDVEAPQAGQDVVLRLMSHTAGRTLALPRDSMALASQENDVPWFYAADIMEHARIMKGNQSYMLEHYAHEIEQLEEQEKHDELMFGEDALWTRKAVASIQDAMAKMRNEAISLSLPSSLPRRQGRTEGVPGHDAGRQASKASRASVITNYERSVSPRAIIEAAQLVPGAASPLGDGERKLRTFTERRRLNSSDHDQKFFYYEAANQFYLSPLDIRILKTAFGEYRNFPTTVLPRVEQVSTGHIVDDDLRRKTKYLSHLPQGAEVAFLECDWTDIVSADILAMFAPDTERRRRRTEEKNAREEKERVRAERAMEDERWAAARRRRPSNYETTAADDAVADAPPPPILDPAEFSPTWPQSQMLRPPTGHGDSQVSTYGALASPSGSPNAVRTVWGTRIAAPMSPPALATATAASHDVPQTDGWLDDWETALLGVEDELTSQLESATLQADGEGLLNMASSSDEIASAVRGGSKKKKAKKITLMSTTARRGA